MKTVRFPNVVAKAGKPQHYLAWAGSGKDKHLKNAAKEARLLTVHQEVRGGKKDHGTVGLEAGRNVQYFIFPRSLKVFEGARVVGIDYGLVDEKLSSAVAPPEPVAKRRQVSRRSRHSGATLVTTASAVTAKRRAAPVEGTAHGEAHLETPQPPAPAEIRAEIVFAIRELRGRQSSSARQRLTRLLARLES